MKAKDIRVGDVGIDGSIIDWVGFDEEATKVHYRDNLGCSSIRDYNYALALKRTQKSIPIVGDEVLVFDGDFWVKDIVSVTRHNNEIDTTMYGWQEKNKWKWDIPEEPEYEIVEENEWEYYYDTVLYVSIGEPVFPDQLKYKAKTGRKFKRYPDGRLELMEEVGE